MIALQCYKVVVSSVKSVNRGPYHFSVKFFLFTYYYIYRPYNKSVGNYCSLLDFDAESQAFITKIVI